MTVDRRVSSAYHEAGHALVAVCLGVGLEAVSLRPGRTFAAVTMLIPVADLGREETEHRIVLTLAGDIAQRFAEPLVGHVKPSEKAARAAVTSLARRSPAAADRLTAAETDHESHDDETLASRCSGLLVWDDWISAAHVLYLHRWALSIVELHRPALRELAGALYEKDVLDGAEVETIVRSFRCADHRGWGPPAASAAETPTERKRQMRSLRNAPAPIYVARSTGMTELDGMDVLFVEGETRVAAGHPLLAAIPSLFEIDASGGPLVEPRYSRPYVDPSSPKVAKPVPPEDVMVATRSFVAASGPAGQLVVYQGQRFEKGHYLVRRFKDAFAPEKVNEP